MISKERITPLLGRVKVKARPSKAPIERSLSAKGKVPRLVRDFLAPTLLITVGVLILIGEHSAAPQRTQVVVVAQTPIEKGAVITAGEVKLESLGVSQELTNTFGGLNEVLGQTSNTNIPKDGIVGSSMIKGSNSSPSGYRLVTVSVPLDVVQAEQIVPGDRVDISATFTASASPMTELLAPKVLVREVYTPPSTLSGVSVSDVVVAVKDEEEALAILYGESAGKIAVVDSTEADAAQAGLSYPPLLPSNATNPATPGTNAPG